MNNLPNRLTILRMLLVPLIMVFLLTDVFSGIVILTVPLSNILAAVIFVAASLTDWFDGRIARKRGMVTNFGKVMDPLADKLLVVAVILCFVARGMFPVWCAMVILARDFLVTGMRVVAVAEGISVAANMWGKVKTSIQMIAMVLLILFGDSEIFFLSALAQAAVYLSTAATLISGIRYCYDYRAVLKK